MEKKRARIWFDSVEFDRGGWSKYHPSNAIGQKQPSSGVFFSWGGASRPPPQNISLRLLRYRPEFTGPSFSFFLLLMYSLTQPPTSRYFSFSSPMLTGSSGSYFFRSFFPSFNSSSSSSSSPPQSATLFVFFPIGRAFLSSLTCLSYLWFV